MVRGVGRAGCVVDEEGLVRGQGLLLPDPADRPVGHVLGEVVALLGGLLRLDRRGAVVDRRVVLVGLATDEAVEVLEAAAAGRPRVERPDRAGLPHRDLVALAELRGRVAVQPQGLGQRRTGVRSYRAVAGGRRGQLRDDPHPHGVMVAPAEQGSAGGRTQRRGVEPVVLQAGRGQPLGRRGLARAAERARGGEAHVVEQDHQHVGRSRRRTHGLDRREGGRRVLGVERTIPLELPIGDGQDAAVVSVWAHGSSSGPQRSAVTLPSRSIDGRAPVSAATSPGPG